jgi:hydrogenase expression/formation protein HypD
LTNGTNTYNNPVLIKNIIKEINKLTIPPVRIMEVCGGHTMAIHRHGIPSLLPETIELLSGPGCPVCVTDIGFIDSAIELSKIENTIICTYGDLIRVPGSRSTLREERSGGANIHVVYSTLDALQIAAENPSHNIIFLGIGFETTAPASAAALVEAKEKNITNFFIFSSHKIMQPAMEALADGDVNLSAYLCPGHVSVITGTNIYKRIASEFNIPCVVSGFEPVDIVQAIHMIALQISEKRSEVEIAYSRAVTEEGNSKAQKLLKQVFTNSDAYWRGLGVIPGSGLKVTEEFKDFDAIEKFKISIEKPKEPKGCICGAILKGKAKPFDCTLYDTVCTPSTPVGACMVSSEGCCAAYHKYTRS